MINYKSLSDTDKIELLRLLYQSVKHPKTELECIHKETIIAETQLVYNRIKTKLN